MDNLARKLDTLAMQFERDSHMIDPVEYGEMKGAVKALQQQIVVVTTKQAEMDVKIDLVLTKLSEAHGGWKMLMLLGGSGASFGAWVAYVFMGGPRP